MATCELQEARVRRISVHDASKSDSPSISTVVVGRAMFSPSYLSYKSTENARNQWNPLSLRSSCVLPRPRQKQLWLVGVLARKRRGCEREGALGCGRYCFLVIRLTLGGTPDVVS